MTKMNILYFVNVVTFPIRLCVKAQIEAFRLAIEKATSAIMAASQI